MHCASKTRRKQRGKRRWLSDSGHRPKVFSISGATTPNDNWRNLFSLIFFVISVEVYYLFKKHSVSSFTIFLKFLWAWKGLYSWMTIFHGYIHQNLLEDSHVKYLWHSFLSKSKVSRKPNSTSCKPSSALSNWQYYHSRSFQLSEWLFQIVFLVSTLSKQMSKP